MSDLTTFHYGEQEVRTLLIDNEPWWILADVCKALGLSRAYNVARRLEDDERDLIPILNSKGRRPKTTIVNESGLYSVIRRSDKPEAKVFKRWIQSDVLPALRKYNNPDKSDDIASEPFIYTKEAITEYAQRRKNKNA